MTTLTRYSDILLLEDVEQLLLLLLDRFVDLLLPAQFFFDVAQLLGGVVTAVYYTWLFSCLIQQLRYLLSPSIGINDLLAARLQLHTGRAAF